MYGKLKKTYRPKQRRLKRKSLKKKWMKWVGGADDFGADDQLTVAAKEAKEAKAAEEAKAAAAATAEAQLAAEVNQKDIVAAQAEIDAAKQGNDSTKLIELAKTYTELILGAISANLKILSSDNDNNKCADLIDILNTMNRQFTELKSKEKIEGNIHVLILKNLKKYNDQVDCKTDLPKDFSNNVSELIPNFLSLHRYVAKPEIQEEEHQGTVGDDEPMAKAEVHGTTRLVSDDASGKVVARPTSSTSLLGDKSPVVGDKSPVVGDKSPVVGAPVASLIADAAKAEPAPAPASAVPTDGVYAPNFNEIMTLPLITADETLKKIVIQTNDDVKAAYVLIDTVNMHLKAADFEKYKSEAVKTTGQLLINVTTNCSKQMNTKMGSSKLETYPIIKKYCEEARDKIIEIQTTIKGINQPVPTNATYSATDDQGDTATATATAVPESASASNSGSNVYNIDATQMIELLDTYKGKIEKLRSQVAGIEKGGNIVINVNSADSRPRTLPGK